MLCCEDQRRSDFCAGLRSEKSRNSCSCVLFWIFRFFPQICDGSEDLGRGEGQSVVSESERAHPRIKWPTMAPGERDRD